MLLFIGMCLSLWSCREKVGLQRDILTFPLAKAFWYEREATLFVFYRLEHPLVQRAQAVLEMSLDGGDNWLDTAAIQNVHQHLASDCGPQVLCGSLSLLRDQALAKLTLRYRYHRDASLGDQTQIAVVQVRAQSPAPQSYSLYGIFDATNTYVQWRGRHQFPGLSHEDAQALGLRRLYRVLATKNQVNSSSFNRLNPSLYGALSSCEGQTLEGAPLFSEAGDDLWQFGQVPVTSAQVCADTEVNQARGTAREIAVARKNPIVEELPQDLQLSFAPTYQIPLIFAACDATDQDFLSFQAERLHFPQRTADLCMDRGRFNPESIIALLYAKIVAAKQTQKLEVSVVLILHYKEAELSAAVVSVVGQALAKIADDELYPRVAAFFIYDSFAPETDIMAQQKSVIWCPTHDGRDDGLASCAYQPAEVVLGSLEVRSAPTLPDYESFLSLDETQKTGAKIDKLDIYAPRETSDTGRIGFVERDGASYIFNPFDRLTLGPTDFVSYCPLRDPSQAFGYRFLDPAEPEKVAIPSPLRQLPTRGREKNETYNLGVRLPVPFLVAVRYTTAAALGPKNFTAYLALRGKNTVDEAFGAAVLAGQPLPFRGVLSQCTQYCNHPAFDESGSYALARPWTEEFATRCYQPLLPQRAGLGI